MSQGTVEEKQFRTGKIPMRLGLDDDRQLLQTPNRGTLTRDAEMTGSVDDEC